jgi:hypothetical protein
VLNFAISGAFNATFQLDSSPIPDVVYDADLPQLFAIAGVSGIPCTTSGLADITFFRDNAGGTGGGLLISDHDGNRDWLLDAGGPQLYTGPEAAPTFKTDSFVLDGFSPRGASILTIAAVPEPASWTLLILGFDLAGVAMRRSRATARVRFSAA